MTDKQQRPDFDETAKNLLAFLESDFCQSGKDVRIEAVSCELQRAYLDGKKETEILKARIKANTNCPCGELCCDECPR